MGKAANRKKVICGAVHEAIQREAAAAQAATPGALAHGQAYPALADLVEHIRAELNRRLRQPVEYMGMTYWPRGIFNGLMLQVFDCEPSANGRPLAVAMLGSRQAGADWPPHHGANPLH